MPDTKLFKIAIMGATTILNCEGKKLRGHKIQDRKLGRFWIPGATENGSYNVYYGSNDFAALRTSKPTRRPSSRPSRKPSNEPTVWSGKSPHIILWCIC